jgi:DNA-3-methyladenine glycosylase
MFGPPGHTYVYFIYGMHWLFNVVAHPHRPPGAVLVRALEPVEGLEVMRGLRGDKPRELLTNGPARLAQALDINGDLNDVDLCTHPALWIERGPGVPEAEVSTGPRVRVVGDESARARPWRFWIEGHPDLSS